MSLAPVSHASAGLRPLTPSSDDPRPEPPRRGPQGRVFLAAFRARRVYPGPVGDLINRELLSWDGFGFRFGGDSQIMRLVAHIETTPIHEFAVTFVEQVPAQAS